MAEQVCISSIRWVHRWTSVNIVTYTEHISLSLIRCVHVLYRLQWRSSVYKFMYSEYTYIADPVFTPSFCSAMIQPTHHIYSEYTSPLWYNPAYTPSLQWVHLPALIWSRLHTIFTTVSTPPRSDMIQRTYQLYYSEYITLLWCDPACTPALLLIKHAQCTSLIQRAQHLYYSEYITDPACTEYITDPACTPALLLGVHH